MKKFEPQSQDVVHRVEQGSAENKDTVRVRAPDTQNKTDEEILKEGVER